MTTIKGILRNDYPEVYQEIQKKIANNRKNNKITYMKEYLKFKEPCNVCGGEFTKGQYMKHARTKKHQTSGHQFLSDEED